MDVDDWLEEMDEDSSSKKDNFDKESDHESNDFFDENVESNLTGSNIVSENKPEEEVDLDDILGEENNYGNNVKLNFSKTELKDTPNVVGEGFHPDFLALVNKVRRSYTRLPYLNSEEIFSEISNLYVPLKENYSLSSLSMDIHKVQAARERMAQIDIEVSRCHVFKKRAVNILLAAWGKFTGEKNAEGRKGDGSFRMSEFELDLADTESIAKGCNGMISNLESSHSALSRRVTLAQNQLKIRELGISEEDFFEMANEKEYDIEDDDVDMN